MSKTKPIVSEKKSGYEYPCTDCNGDAYIGYSANKKSGWNGKVKKGERICLLCGRKRGLNFFSR